jgi:hypothetical protein
MALKHVKLPSDYRYEILEAGYPKFRALVCQGHGYFKCLHSHLESEFRILRINYS